MNCASVSSITRASLIIATTYIAKFCPAPTSHVIASYSSFDPNGTRGTLLEFRSSNKVLKSLIKKVRISILFKFLAWLFLVSIWFAFQAILFLAFWTNKIFTISFLVKNKCIVTVRSRTPWNILLFRKSNLKRVILKTFVIFSRKQIF